MSVNVSGWGCLEELAARNSWLLVRWHKKRGLYSPLADPIGI